MKFSLVMATVGRVSEPARFLRALQAQTHRPFELIVVDQNPDDRVLRLLEEYRTRFPIKHLRSPTGASRARNAGIPHAAGEIVSFPDDDSWYPDDLLARVARMMGEHPEWDGINGRFTDESGRSVAGRWDGRPGRIDRFNVWKRGTVCSSFLRRRVVGTVGGFDETLGVGSGTPWGSGEETDYLIRALEKGFRLHYDPALCVNHPDPLLVYDRKTLRRAFSYGMGMGRVLRNHRDPFWFVLYHWLRPLGGMSVSALSGNWRRACYYWEAFRGRFQGWFGWA